jgi:hypothetical protein
MREADVGFQSADTIKLSFSSCFQAGAQRLGEAASIRQGLLYKRRSD